MLLFCPPLHSFHSHFQFFLQRQRQRQRQRQCSSSCFGRNRKNEINENSHKYDHDEQKNKNKNKTNLLQYLPKTDNQIQYVKQLHDRNSSIVLGLGPAGTGKSLLACVYAIQLLKKQEINKIVLTRPIVTVENEELGFLPGNLVSKMDPWTKPLLDIFSEFYQLKELKQMMQNEIIEISPLAYMRGRTFKNACMIADEMQNSTPSQMLMLLTRIGENSKLILTGDINQSDRSMDENGLLDLIHKLQKKKIPGISMTEMTQDDIQRSQIVANILDLYDEDEE